MASRPTSSTWRSSGLARAVNRNRTGVPGNVAPVRNQGGQVMGIELAVVFFAITGGFGIYTAALALGIRHGIDWDHIAAITDITSARTASEEDESWLLA